MFFKCLQWTDVLVPFCFQRSWLQLSLKMQGEVNTWCLAGENIHCVGCLWKQHQHLTWILVLFAFSKTEFFLKKKVAFSIPSIFMCLNSAFIVKAFSGSEGALSGTEKNPRIRREQNTCPWEVKHRFKSLTWFCSLAGECLDHSTENEMG